MITEPSGYKGTAIQNHPDIMFYPHGIVFSPIHFNEILLS
jgi:hypothetical protein